MPERRYPRKPYTSIVGWAYGPALASSDALATIYGRDMGSDYLPVRVEHRGVHR